MKGNNDEQRNKLVTSEQAMLAHSMTVHNARALIKRKHFVRLPFAQFRSVSMFCGCSCVPQQMMLMGGVVEVAFDYHSGTASV